MTTEPQPTAGQDPSGQEVDGAPAAWTLVDEGWGRRAVDFSTLSEPANCREYVTVHHRLGVGTGDRLLDIACASGLAIELAGLRGARCAGIDASPRLVAVARDRNPEADIRVGDMHALPWPDASFDVVTSFRGIWGTTPAALGEVRRVLAPGGRLGLTVWGHIKRSPGAWALAPFRMADPQRVANQAAMVSLGRPGAGEEILDQFGFVEIERIDVPFVWEFADPEAYARALASTGPAYEAIMNVGEAAFIEAATERARALVRDGLPLRAPIAVVGYLARKPVPRRTSPAADRRRGEIGFLSLPEHTDEAQRHYDEDVAELGYVMNVSRLWSYQPTALTALFDLVRQIITAGELTLRQRGILVAACAATIEDSYCALAWGTKLAQEASAQTASAVLRGEDTGLSTKEQAMARWTRKVAGDASGVSDADVRDLREAGYSDGEIFTLTVFVALRIAFSTVNDALGVRPDAPLRLTAPEAVLKAVTFGRPIEDPRSEPGSPTPPPEGRAR